MADLFCSFLDFQSLNTNFKFHLFLAPKHYCSSALVPSHSLRINGIKRRPLHLTLFSRPSSPNFDVISTHEHADGSLLFRFGDPSEAAKNVKMEESKTVKEEIEREGEDGYTVVKVLDGDHEAEVIVKKADREVTSSGLTEVADRTDSIVISSGSISVIQVDNDSREKLLEGSNDSELPVLNSSKDIEVISPPDIDIEHVGNVEEDLNGEHEDSSLVAKASILDENSENGNSVATVEVLEEETVGVTSTPGFVMEHTGNVEEVLNEECGDSSPTDASILGKSSEMENISTEVELLERDTAESTTLISLMPKPITAVPDNDVFQASIESVLTTDASADSEHQNLESEMQNESVEGGRESIENDLESPPPQSQTAISLSQEIEDQNLQARVQDLTKGKGGDSEMNQTGALGMTTVVDSDSNENDMNDTEAKYPPIPNEAEESGTESGVLNEIVEDGSESAVIPLNTVSPQLKAEPMLDEETGTDISEESAEDDGAESLTVLNDVPQNLILESEGTEVNDNLQSRKLVEASGHELTELKSTESATESQEILQTNFVLSSGAALLPHPSKVLTGGEDAYFIAGQTWLGVADGVGQWSLEGTKQGVYARELMKNCEKFIADHNGDSLNNPMELLNLSVAETHYPGPSTVLIAQLVGQDLHVANVGDSGFIVLRHGAVYKRSSPMVHAFHFTKRIETGDDPSHLAELYRVDLEEDDMIITATDGLLDNLYDQEISSIVVNSLAADKKLEEIAELLATKAQDVGSSMSGRSPFADEAQAAGFAGYTGGKLDDVAVIVSIVQRQSTPQTM
ncbi:probable protein phosphatase 2C 62 isoform X1 [Sesamum indicum]|uniref:Probable protein phosphatase 2C 62 isoform X1 n=1 Tax=Sesamum indicum TaxID=4182 RepID=A0A6I9TQ89_SESIN|nr:probable protein phosphatase 2C 62 isoform X1 [Sesamum indicum]